MKIKEQKTCFAICKEKNSACRSVSCKNFLVSKQNLNCVLIAAQNGPKTLQQIGDIFGLTRMRICQIEKSALKKIKEFLHE